MAENIPEEDSLDKLFAKGGWMVTVGDSDHTKIASCDPDETNVFTKTRDHWVEMPKSEASDKKIKNSADYFGKMHFEEAGRFNGSETRIGFYFIRDLLNMKKPNPLSKVFMDDKVPVLKVMLCARITSVDFRKNYHRLTLDDGTSTILCMVQLNEECEDIAKERMERKKRVEVKAQNMPNDEKNAMLFVFNKLIARRKELESYIPTSFDETSLGKIVQVVGNLQEYKEKNSVFASSIRWVNEEYFVNHMQHVVQFYEMKGNGFKP